MDVKPGVVETVEFDQIENQLILKETYDAEPIIRRASILADDPPKGKFWRHAAYIPAHVFNQAAREGWLNDKKAWKKWANDSDNSRFRTWNGRL